MRRCISRGGDRQCCLTLSLSGMSTPSTDPNSPYAYAQNEPPPLVTEVRMNDDRKEDVCCPCCTVCCHCEWRCCCSHLSLLLLCYEMKSYCVACLQLSGCCEGKDACGLLCTLWKQAHHNHTHTHTHNHAYSRAQGFASVARAAARGASGTSPYRAWRVCVCILCVTCVSLQKASHL